MAFKKPEGGIDFAAISAKMDEERKKIAAMTPEERQAYQQAKEDARMAEYRAENEKANTATKAKYRQSILSGHVIGPIETTFAPQHFGNPLRTSESDRTIEIIGSISDKPPSDNPEKDFKNAPRFSLMLPENEAIQIIKQYFQNNDYNKETYTQAPYSARSNEKLYLPVQNKVTKRRAVALEYNFGKNKWPNLPTYGQTTNNRSFLLNPNATTTPNTTQNTALILIAPASNQTEHAKTLIEKTNNTISNNPQYTDIRVIGHNKDFAQKIADDIQVTHPKIRTAALTHDKFRNMNSEQQTKTLEYINQKTDTITYNDQTNAKEQLINTLKQSAATKNKQQDQSR